MRLKTIAALFVMLLLAFKFEVADASTFKKVKIVENTSSPIEVYEKPNAQSNVLGTVSLGTFVTFISDWHNTFYSRVICLDEDGKIIEGYVLSYYLGDARHDIKVASSKGGLVVKETPSLDGKTVATLQHNMVVSDFGSVGDGWSYVQSGNVIGYAATNFISDSKPVTKYASKSGLVVRNIASTSGARVGELFKYDKVSVHSTIAGWSYITSLAYEGYVEASQLTSERWNKKFIKI